MGSEGVYVSGFVKGHFAMEENVYLNGCGDYQVSQYLVSFKNNKEKFDLVFQNENPNSIENFNHNQQ